MDTTKACTLAALIPLIRYNSNLSKSPESFEVLKTPLNPNDFVMLAHRSYTQVVQIDKYSCGHQVDPWKTKWLSFNILVATSISFVL